jgi:hypothetical protein
LNAQAKILYIPIVAHTSLGDIVVCGVEWARLAKAVGEFEVMRQAHALLLTG